MTGGVNMNLVPKDGGNRCAAASSSPSRPSSWQGDNLTDELSRSACAGVDKIANFYEFNVEQGGPILRDKLWFFGAFRKAQYDKPIANTFVPPANANVPAFVPAVHRRRRAAASRASRDEKMDNPVVRLTWQMSRAQQVRGLHGPRPAPARPRDELADRSEHGVGGLEHADLRDRLGQVDLDGVVDGSCSRTASRSTASATTTCISPASSPTAARAAWYRNVRKNDTSTGPAVERVERAARQLSRPLQPASRPRPT